MAMDEQTDRIMLTLTYLHEDDDALLMVLKSTAQVGVTSLHIFQHVFTERFIRRQACSRPGMRSQ
jgi:hypothetical protein